MAKRILTEAETRKAKRGKCITKHCRKGREENVGSFYLLCSGCREREKKITHPWIQRYRALKLSAKRRNIQVYLTYSEFKQFCLRTEMIPLGLSVDRIDPTKGYSLDNMRVLTFSENSSLGGVYGNERKKQKRLEYAMRKFESPPIAAPSDEDPF